MSAGIVFAILGIAGLFLVLGVLAKIRSITKDVAPLIEAISGTDFDQIEAEYATTPKSVSGMTSLCIPRIAKDFPEFNWNEFKQKAENMLLSAFHAIEEEDASLVVNASSDLRSQVALMIDNNRNAGHREIFREAVIHQTEIKDYRKEGGSCVITLQSSVGYYHYKTDRSGTIVAGSNSVTTQTRYDTELVYVQDTSLVKDGQKALGSTCPNCGAPIKNLGSKECPYCGCGLTEISIRVWNINRFTES
ncbi:MAG: zinc ribbon domain-containing protein [Lachnospiraceae bacterium]|nr:zinc ribbon domain-containing protein [Lachnospiraceae bacterium]